MKDNILSHLGRSFFLVALAHLIVEFCSNFMPVVYPLLISSMGLTYTQVGFIVLVGVICGSLTQPLFGYLSDRWGAQRLMVMSLAWLGLVMGLIGFAKNYSSLVLLVGLGALGSAAFHPAGATLALARGGKRRGTAISIFSVGGNLGTALSPLWIAVVIGWWGLQGTLVLAPLGVLAGLYLYWQLGRVGFAEDNQPSRSQARPDHQKRVENGAPVMLALIIIAIMCRSWFQVALITYLPEWIQNQGGSLTIGGQLLFVFMISVSLGGLVGGVLSDYIGRWQVLILSLGLLSPTYWLFLGAVDPWRIVWVAVMGVLIGATFPVSLVMAQEIWPRRVGLALALVMGVGWTPGGIGASVTGFVADRSSLTVGLQSLIILPLVGVGAILIYVALQRRRPVSTEADLVVGDW